MNLDAIKQSESASFKKKNPHIFGMQTAKQFMNVPGLAGGLTEIKSTNTEPKKKRIRQSEKPVMNKLEGEWYNHVAIFRARPQAIKFKLANGAFYKPDFFSFNVMTAWEVKGNKGKNIDRGKLALKVAATAWPEIKFILVWKDEQGRWREQHVLP